MGISLKLALSGMMAAIWLRFNNPTSVPFFLNKALLIKACSIHDSP
jgi:hypothetical protein